MAAWIPVLIQILPFVETGVTEFIAWIESLITAAKQSGEWTPEQDAAWRAACFAKTSDPKYAPDAS